MSIAGCLFSISGPGFSCSSCWGCRHVRNAGKVLQTINYYYNDNSTRSRSQAFFTLRLHFRFRFFRMCERYIIEGNFSAATDQCEITF